MNNVNNVNNVNNFDSMFGLTEAVFGTVCRRHFFEHDAWYRTLKSDVEN